MSEFDNLRQQVEQLKTECYRKGFYEAMCVILDQLYLGKTITAKLICDMIHDRFPEVEE